MVGARAQLVITREGVAIRTAHQLLRSLALTAEGRHFNTHHLKLRPALPTMHNAARSLARLGPAGSRLQQLARRTYPGASCLIHPTQIRLRPSSTTCHGSSNPPCPLLHAQQPTRLLATVTDGIVHAQGHGSVLPDAVPTISEEEPMTFDSLESIAPAIKQAIKTRFRYTTMTPVQAKLLPRLPVNGDLLVKAKTGTGKTLAFLIPLVSEMAMNPDYKALVLSPTRELALQIHKEAQPLLRAIRRHGVCLVGGEMRRYQMRELERYSPSLVVGTPGRTIDLSDSHPVMSKFTSGADTLVIDEADRMLEVGNRQEVLDIVERMRSSQDGRKTYLFSATFPRNVNELIRIAMDGDNLQKIDAHEGEQDNEQDTLKTIQQKYTTVSGKDLPLALWNTLKNHKNEKVIVFFPTTKMVALYSRVFGRTFRPIELHSGIDQARRSNRSDTFRNAKTGVLFTSDVSARGVDYPHVSLVIQVGAPTSKDQYVHRIGRTGRAGRSGTSLIMLSEEELPFITTDLKNEGVQEEPWSPLDGEETERTREFIQRQGRLLPFSQMSDAYNSMFGYYTQQMEMLRDGQTMGEEVNSQFTSLGMEMVPENFPTVFDRAIKGFQIKSRRREQHRMMVERKAYRQGFGGRGGNRMNSQRYPRDGRRSQNYGFGDGGVRRSRDASRGGYSQDRRDRRHSPQDDF